ncbi:MAG: hypothetical protein EAZ57_10760 [Cytophagales bacterium]|nr:MAG: hypothetical protein EAZ57_10760 [Cytophagales bacterium]
MMFQAEVCLNQVYVLVIIPAWDRFYILFFGNLRLCRVTCAHSAACQLDQNLNKPYKVSKTL